MGCYCDMVGLKRVQSFQYIREEEVSDLVNKIRRGCAHHQEDDRFSMNMSELIIATSHKIVSRCLVGHKFETADGKNRFEDLTRKVMVQLDDVLAQHKAAMSNEDEDHKSEKKDFLDILLHCELTQSDHKAMILVSLFFLLNSVFMCVQLDYRDLFLGGNESTSAAMEWAFAELMRNPRVTKKAQEEVRRVIGNKSKVEQDDVKQMKYLGCVVKETLRLHPPFALSVPRETRSGVTLGGYYIPPNTIVFVNLWGIQRDPEFWERP
ncbi:hypothetical protein K1719_045435 [Acacia pycnantha]|nr:hypothetical protein K1719_045435 [Acacia pycnantha]